ncbi:MAG: DegT/DnrJ/EryC1/StrS family aminotransferase [Dehalococcoidia bacterium]
MEIPFVDLRGTARRPARRYRGRLPCGAGQLHLHRRTAGGLVRGGVRPLRGAHAAGVASGTDALELALRAAGVGPGDIVVTPPNTFIATV